MCTCEKDWGGEKKREEGRESGGLARNRRRSQKTKLVFWGGMAMRCAAALRGCSRTPKKNTLNTPGCLLPACAVRPAQVGGGGGVTVIQSRRDRGGRRARPRDAGRRRAGSEEVCV